MEPAPDLDTLLGIGTSPTLEERNDALGHRLLTVREQLKKLKDEERSLEDAIWTQTPDEPGDFIVDGKQLVLNVSRSETWKFDSAKLEKLAAKSADVSAVVQSKFSLPRNAYLPLLSTLGTTEIKELEETLTRKPGKPRIKITEKK